MASVSGVSSSSSIYGNRNVLTGLASGLDTETMIENAISAYKTKITSLQQKRTKTEWQQEAYRSIINKMSVFMDKYTSYRSSNNLMSASFFNQAVKTVTKGANASKVSATGRSSSDIQIDRVLQLASSASYKLSGSKLDTTTSAFGSDRVAAAAGEALDLNGTTTLGGLSGTVTLAYGGSNALSYLSLSFDETKPYANAEELVDDINKQLEGQTITIGTNSYTGEDLLNNVIKAQVGEDGMSVTFTDPKKNNVYVSNATGAAKQLLLGGQETSSVSEEQIHGLTISSEAFETREVNNLKYLSDKGASMSITLDGVTKTVKLPGADKIGNLAGEDRDKVFMEEFQKNIDDVFGKGKINVSDANTGTDDGIRFQFDVAKGSTFSVSSTQGEILGFGESKQVTSYLNTEKTLGDLLGKSSFEGLGFSVAQEDVLDSNGNKIGTKDKTDADGNKLYSFMVNGTEVGQFNEKSTLSQVMSAMNSNSESGVKVGYSKLTNELTFTAKDTGAASEIRFEGLAAQLFGTPGEDGSGTYTKGQDAIFEATVNGTSLGQMTRSSNSIEIDGMTINLKGTFGYQTNEDGSIKYEQEQAKDADGKLLFDFQGVQKPATETENGLEFYDEKTGKTIIGKLDSNGEMTFWNQNNTQVYARTNAQGRLSFDAEASQGVNPSAVMNKTAIQDKSAEAVTFETSSDADKIVEVVKQMVDDYNALASEIKSAYSTLPAQRSNGAYYEPLTDDDMDGMSESSIKSWEDKAKQGILFGDRDLATLYQRLTSAVSMTGENGAALRAAGITVSYSNGLSTLEFNETEFRSALENDPDKVRDAFTASVDAGAKQNGLMQSLMQPLEMYGKTSGGKGILVEKAGSPLAASTMYTNTIQKELNSIDEQIEKWQDKMSSQIDYYTNQFSKLEQLVQQMNSQSSYFSQLMGG